MKPKQQIKNGQVVVKTPLAQELPDIQIMLQSGRTTYRFTGSYDGWHSAPAKLLRLMERDNSEKDGDAETSEHYNKPMQSCMEGCPEKGGK